MTGCHGHWQYGDARFGILIFPDRPIFIQLSQPSDMIPKLHAATAATIPAAAAAVAAASISPEGWIVLFLMLLVTLVAMGTLLVWIRCHWLVSRVAAL